jgi:hypothetical protein
MVEMNEGHPVRVPDVGHSNRSHGPIHKPTNAQANRIILLVEDNPDDVDLTLRALRKYNVMNEVVIARRRATYPH